MTDKSDKKNINNSEYQELVMELKKELPNIILPSMGMYDDVDCIKINGKDFVIGDKEV